ncbi:MAG: triose-phosphate isomerase [bacterium]|nr:triose-phosphate isomerase [bacterium]
MRTPVFAANWKMNKTAHEAREFLSKFKTGLSGNSEVVVCPPFTALGVVLDECQSTPIAIGAQNGFHEASGAFTGEVSMAMLHKEGVTHVIVGHSERRDIFGETDGLIQLKISAALQLGLTVIFCVGEHLDVRESGGAMALVESQVRAGLNEIVAAEFGHGASLILAFEPVWAIGTGKVATPEQAQDVHAGIRDVLSALYGADVAERIRILYGGSVKPDNVAGLMEKPDIDGALVGGASLKVEDFLAICQPVY